MTAVLCEYMHFKFNLELKAFDLTLFFVNTDKRSQSSYLTNLENIYEFFGPNVDIMALRFIYKNAK